VLEAHIAFYCTNALHVHHGHVTFVLCKSKNVQSTKVTWSTAWVIMICSRSWYDIKLSISHSLTERWTRRGLSSQHVWL